MLSDKSKYLGHIFYCHTRCHNIRIASVTRRGPKQDLNIAAVDSNICDISYMASIMCSYISYMLSQECLISAAKRGKKCNSSEGNGKLLLTAVEQGCCCT